MIAKGKFDVVEPLLKYDITTYNYLFDGDNMTSCDQLIRELERRISSSDYDYSISRVDVAIVDFMSFVRNQKVDRLNFRTFGSCIEELFNQICNTYEKTELLHFIFDSYIPESWKGAKRRRGQNV